jgi:hypothetical protein
MYVSAGRTRSAAQSYGKILVASPVLGGVVRRRAVTDFSSEAVGSYEGWRWGGGSMFGIDLIH